MATVWHEQAFARDAYRLVDKQFVAGLKTYSTSTVVFGTGILWLQIIVGWGLAFASDWLAIVALVLFIAAQQRAGIWVHEASHRNLFQNRKLNDLWGNVFFGSPIGMNVAAYRATHLSHHMHMSLNDDLDREVHDIDLAGRSFWTVLGRSLLGYYGFRVLFAKYISFFLRRSDSQRQTGADRMSVENIAFLAMTAAWNGVFLLGCIFAGRWYFYFLLWLYPLFSVAQFIKIVRTVLEHQPLGYPAVSIEEKPVVRTTLPSALEGWLIYCNNFNYHLEHHLWPQVPFFHLPQLHVHLMERGYYKLHPDLLRHSGVSAVAGLRQQGKTAEAITLASNEVQ